MKSLTAYHYDAFSKEPNKGNPAGVVLGGDHLTDEEMQEIALSLGFNATAFLLKSEIADVKIRFFKPQEEVDLCGHATIAAIYALQTRGLLEKEYITIETRAGNLPIRINEVATGEFYIMMQQVSPQFVEFQGSKKALVNSIGLEEDDIDTSFPILYGSTGVWTLLVPINKLETFKKMKPNNKIFPEILKEIPEASIHPFCLETYHSNVDMHGRHFSSPNSGTVEDAVTGTASGVMGAFYATYINNDFEKELNLVIEQGQEMGKDGQVGVKVLKNKEHYDIEITGTAVYVKEFGISIQNIE